MVIDMVDHMKADQRWSSTQLQCKNQQLESNRKAFIVHSASIHSMFFVGQWMQTQVTLLTARTRLW